MQILCACIFWCGCSAVQPHRCKATNELPGPTTPRHSFCASLPEVIQGTKCIGAMHPDYVYAPTGGSIFAPIYRALHYAVQLGCLPSPSPNCRYTEWARVLSTACYFLLFLGLSQLSCNRISLYTTLTRSIVRYKIRTACLNADVARQ